MTARLATAGLVLAGLLASASGLGPGRGEAQSRAALVAQGRELLAARECLRCHTVGPVGTPIGPDLGRAGARYPEETLARWLREPAAQEPTRHMPTLDLSAAEATALAAYLASLR